MFCRASVVRHCEASSWQIVGVLEEGWSPIDPNVWRNASESGEKIACTSFAPVVVEILKVIGSLKPEQCLKHKQELFPAVCMLIRVQSEEIRQLV
jgi:hypothetical protein